MRHHLVGYGPITRSRREVFHADSLLEANRIMRRPGAVPVEWVGNTPRGRELLGADSVPAQELPFPKGIRPCRACQARGCEKCEQSGIVRGSR